MILVMRYENLKLNETDDAESTTVATDACQ
jgi:hypothetical protein